MTFRKFTITGKLRKKNNQRKIPSAKQAGGIFCVVTSCFGKIFPGQYFRGSIAPEMCYGREERSSVAGLSFNSPSEPKREPWQGQSQECSAGL